MSQVELRGVSKRYPTGVEAVASVDLVIESGTLLAIVGPSGSGKSTLLRLIAGLEALSAGSLWIGGRRADGLPPVERDVAMVFQHPALYPHLSVFDNLAFGLRARGRPRSEVRERVAAVADQLALTELLGRAPRTLSGGQRQRVALGRAIARRPGVYLLDEPFSSLDAPLRAALREELLDLHRALGATMIHVTHDQAEALALGEIVAVMSEGRIVQVGTPMEVYDRPATRFVAQFIGSPPMNLLPCEVASQGGSILVRVEGADWEEIWTLSALEPAAAPLRDLGASRVSLGVRPEHLIVRGLTENDPGMSGTGWRATLDVLRLEPLGNETIATLGWGIHRLHARLPARAAFRPSDQVRVRIDPVSVTWFDGETGRALRLSDTSSRSDSGSTIAGQPRGG